jgi:hypothetical protein
MITASQAAELAYQADLEDLPSILASIEQRAKQGEYHYYYTFDTHKAYCKIEQKLQELGYITETVFNQMDGNYIKITWDHLKKGI